MDMVSSRSITMRENEHQSIGQYIMASLPWLPFAPSSGLILAVLELFKLVACQLSHNRAGVMLHVHIFYCCEMRELFLVLWWSLYADVPAAACVR